MPGKISANLNNLANKWEQTYEKSPDVAAKVTSEIVKNGVKLIGPVTETAAGVLVGKEVLENLSKIVGGQENAAFLKNTTSNSDATLGMIGYSVAGMVAAGMTIHGAIRAVAIIANAVEKE